MPRRILLVPPVAGPGALRSVERVAGLTRAALARGAETVEIEGILGRDPASLAAALGPLRPGIDAVFDLSALARTGRVAPELPVVVWALGSLTHGAGFLSARRRHFKVADTLLVNCRADLAVYERLLGGSGPNARLVPFAVDTDRFRPLDGPARAELRRRLGFSPADVVVVWAGRLNVQKNVHLLLALLAAALPRAPFLRLALAGAEDDIPLAWFGVGNRGYGERVRREASCPPLAGRVDFLGPLGDADLAELFAAADLFVSPSLQHDENFGFAPVEAMAAGLPALVTDWGGYRDSVVEGATGVRFPTLLVERGVRAAWRRAVPALVRLAHDAHLRARLGAAARARADREYSFAAFASRLLAALDEAAGRRGEPARHGDEAFRFHPLVRRLQARNALRQLAHERAGEPLAAPLAGDELEIYRYLIAPYATRDAAADEARPDDRPVALLETLGTERGLRSVDPLWPLDVEGDREALAAVAAGDGTRSLAEIAAAAGLAPAAALSAATRLARAGLVDLGRSTALDQAAPGE